MPPKPEPKPVPLSKPKGAKKVTETTYEVLNTTASSPAPVPEPSPEPEDDAEDDEEASLPQLTPALEGFSKIPISEFEKSFRYIQAHRDVYVSGASDALLVAAFSAEGDGKRKYAKQCVHQSLLLQYCEKLGKDGPRMFFKK